MHSKKLPKNLKRLKTLHKIRVRPIFYVNETTLEHVRNGIHGEWLTIYFLIIRRIPIY
jgi:hypothetical protein